MEISSILNENSMCRRKKEKCHLSRKIVVGFALTKVVSVFFLKKYFFKKSIFFIKN
jgi:hypothetical protein